MEIRIKMYSKTLGQRLHELIKESGFEQQEIAKQLNIKRSTFNGYVNDSREPKLETLTIIADYFAVTADYLIGHSNKKTNVFYSLPEELDLFVKDPANAIYIEMAMEIKSRPLTSSNKPEVL
jgi:transcriptional regulator with XRE-family HTH domain